MLLALAVLGVVTFVTPWMSSASVASPSAKVASPRSTTDAAVSDFVRLMKQATDTHYLLTYHVGGFNFLAYGKIVVAQMPSPPGTKAMTNADGYSGTGRSAYVFRGPSGRIVQWIQNGTNVSACVNVLLKGTYVSGTFGRLECSRPSPFIPSNGFSLEGEGFVPTYILSSVTGMALAGAAITARHSPTFGALRCLVQRSGTTTQTTCINGTGFIVTWNIQSGLGSFSRAILSSLSRDPTADDFHTLIPPTRALILPPV